VALFSTTPCAPGNTKRVLFQEVGSAVSATTNAARCVATTTRNFLVAGMHPTADMMYAQVLNASGNVIHTGNRVRFHTGSLPSDVAFPLFTVVKPASPQGQAFPVVLHALLNVGAFFGTPVYVPVATDLSGNVIWYYPQP